MTNSWLEFAGAVERLLQPQRPSATSASKVHERTRCDLYMGRSWKKFSCITIEVTGLRPATLGSEFEQRPQLRVHRFVMPLRLPRLGLSGHWMSCDAVAVRKHHRNNPEQPRLEGDLTE